MTHPDASMKMYDMNRQKSSCKCHYLTLTIVVNNILSFVYSQMVPSIAI